MAPARQAAHDTKGLCSSQIIQTLPDFLGPQLSLTSCEEFLVITFLAEFRIPKQNDQGVSLIDANFN
jgi:hypothetical protein